MYEELHKVFNGLERYYLYDFISKVTILNGVYILFEKGESFNGLERITRIGSHPSNGRFLKRLQDHFNNNHRKSIMRKHIGRCFLNIEKDPYIKIWNYSNSDIKKGSTKSKGINIEKENLINKKIDEYLKNFSFCIIPNLSIVHKRMEIESQLIATFNQLSPTEPSENWLGLNHPNDKIVNSGLWNIQGLEGDLLSKKNLELVKLKLLVNKNDKVKIKI